MKIRIIVTVLFAILPLGMSFGQEEAVMPAGSKHNNNFDSKAVREFHGIKWKFQMPYEGTALTVCEDKVFVGCYGYDANSKSQQGCQYALDKLTGKIIWQKQINEQLSSPAIYKGVAFYGSKKNKVIALDIHDGNNLWHYDDLKGPVCSPPVPVDNKLFFGNHGKEWCVLDCRDGHLIKKLNTNNGICCYPSYDQDKIYFVEWDGKLHSFDVETLTDTVFYQFDGSGKTAPNMNDEVAPTLYGGCGYLVNANGIVYAINIKSGEFIWTFKADGQIWGTPSIKDDVCVFVSDKSHIYAVDTKTGNLKWDIAKSGKIYTTASIAENIVYAACGDNNLYALELETGNEVWKFKSEDTIGPPWIDDKVIYFSSGKYIYAIE
jgi:outer membrane protein assembly factor BamB